MMRDGSTGCQISKKLAGRQPGAVCAGNASPTRTRRASNFRTRTLSGSKRFPVDAARGGLGLSSARFGGAPMGSGCLRCLAKCLDAKLLKAQRNS